MNFWKTLKKPLFVLAPMADVTDAAFRRIIAKYGKPDVMFTEFTSVAGLCSVGREKLLVDFWYTEAERPIVAQIFGSNPEHFYKSAQLIQELGFDGIDINMGCPERNVEKQGSCAALIKNPELAKKIIAETKRGAGTLPVSVKTRLGYNTISKEWISHILDAEPAALTIHGRTRKEMSKVPAHWDVIGEIVEMVHDRYGKNDRPLILGNGDVENLEQAQEKVNQYGVDGVMIGRGIFGNPFLFANLRTKTPRSEQSEASGPPLEQRLSVMLEHTFLFEKLFTGIKNFDVMKKHYKAYVNGFDGAKELRVRLMTCKTAAEVAAIVTKEFPEIIPPSI